MGTTARCLWMMMVTWLETQQREEKAMLMLNIHLKCPIDLLSNFLISFVLCEL